MKKNFYACHEHLDDVIDDSIFDYDVAPDINLSDDSNYKCEYCSELAKYVISFDLYQV